MMIMINVDGHDDNNGDDDNRHEYNDNGDGKDHD
jgi:hypothetical protein